MGNYQVDYRKLGALVGVVALVAAGAYFLLGSDTEVIDDESFQLTVEQDEFSPGETVRIIAEDQEGEPVEGVEVEVNNESIGTTNVNGIAGYRVPEDTHSISITAEKGGETSNLTLEVDEGTFEDEDSETEDETGGEQQDGTEEEDEEADNGDEEADNGDEEADNGDEEVEHGFNIQGGLKPGEPATLELLEDGVPVEGATIHVNGEEKGETTTAGTLTFTTPKASEIEVETDHEGIEPQAFDVDNEEPEITLEKPSDGEELETFEGESTEIEFRYIVETTEDTGESTLNINGEEHSTGLEPGENTVTEQIDLSGGNYNWEIEVETDEFTESSDSRHLNINEIEPKEGLSISGSVEVGNTVTAVLYQDDDPVEGETIYLDGEDQGETDEFGELSFEIPNTEEITIDTDLDGIDPLTEQVDGYEPAEPVEFNINSPEQDEVIEDYETEFEFAIQTQEEDFDVELQINDETRFEDTVTGDSEGYQEEKIIGDANNHQWQVIVEQDGETFDSDTITFETTENIPEPEIEFLSPSDGEEIDDAEVLLAYEYSYGLGHTSEIIINDNVEKSEQHPEGTTKILEEETVLESGEHTFEAKIDLKLIEKTFNEKIEFTTTEEISIAQFNLNYPTNEESGPGGEVSFDVEALEDIQVRAIYEHLETGNEEIIVDRELDEGDEENGIIGEYDIEDGEDYEWYVEAETSDEKFKQSDRFELY